MKDFKELTVFQKSREFNRLLYKKTSTFPENENFGVTSQMRRASVSILTNIAEGCGRNSDRDFARFLQISYASACEVECLILTANDLGYFDNDTRLGMIEQLTIIKKMIYRFMQRLRLKTDG
jgi:four helix bundle protein